MFNAEPLQVGLVLLQPLYGFVAFHKNKHNKTEGRCHDFHLVS
jgi:hypothetical protein